VAHEVTVSAIMPTYNAMPYLRDAIESVLAQTFTDWELIVVNDASTDASAALLAQYTDPRIRVYRLPENAGRARARNLALQWARGKYIAPCDSDDLCLPERFAREVAYLDQHPEVGVVSSQIEYFWRDAPPQVRLLYPEDNAAIQRRFARGKMAVPFMAAMIRAACFAHFGPFCEEMRRAEDLEWFLRVRHATTFHVLPEFLHRYRHEVRGIAFGKWMESAQYAQYAVYRAEAATHHPAVSPVSFARYSRRWQNRVRLATWEVLKYLNFQARSRLGTRRLR